MNRPYLALAIFLTATLAGCSNPAPPVAVNPAETLTDPPSAETAAHPAAIPPEAYLNFTVQDTSLDIDGVTIHATVYLPAEPRAGFEAAQRFGTIVNLSTAYGTQRSGTDQVLSPVTADNP